MLLNHLLTRYAIRKEFRSSDIFLLNSFKTNISLPTLKKNAVDSIKVCITGCH